MAEIIDISELYTSVASSVEVANRVLEESTEDAEFSYAVTELDFSVPFDEIVVQGGKVGISLAKEHDKVSAVKSLRFSVRIIPKAAVQQVDEDGDEDTPILVPDLLNLSLEEAKAKLKEWKLGLGKASYDRRKKPYGRVVAQLPTPLTRAKSGDKVDLTISGMAPPKPRSKKSGTGAEKSK